MGLKRLLTSTLVGKKSFPALKAGLESTRHNQPHLTSNTSTVPSVSSYALPGVVRLDHLSNQVHNTQTVLQGGGHNKCHIALGKRGK